MKKYNAVISKIIQNTKTVRTLVIDLREPFDFEAGQFVNLMFKKNDKLLRRPYSIASEPNNSNFIELCIKLVEKGEVTHKIFNLKEKDNVEIMGPLGLFKITESKKEKLVFIGAGTGITPLRSMIKNLLQKETSKELLLILGIRYENEILFREEFEDLENKNPNFKFVPIISKPTENWLGRQKHVQNNLDLIDPLNSDVYLCGLSAMIEETTNKLIEKGMSKENIHCEKYA